VFDHGGHCICVSEVQSKELTHGGRLYQHKWMHTVRLLATCAIIFNWLLAVCPHCPGAFTEHKIGVALTQAEDLLRRQCDIHLQIFIHQDQSGLFGTYNIFTSALVSKLKAKWLLEDFKAAHVQTHLRREARLVNVVKRRSIPVLVSVSKLYKRHLRVNLTDLEANIVKRQVIDSLGHHARLGLNNASLSAGFLGIELL